jgi:hypothetical protein
MGKRRCANGANCVAYPVLGEPTKLSRRNTADVCYRCEERGIDASLPPAELPTPKTPPSAATTPPAEASLEPERPDHGRRGSRKKRRNGTGGRPRRRRDGRWEARYTVRTAEGPKRRSVYAWSRE